MYFIETWFGIFIVDSELNVVDSKLYSEDVDEIVRLNRDFDWSYVKGFDAEPAPLDLEREFRLNLWGRYEERYRSLLHEVGHQVCEGDVEVSLEDRGEDVIRAVETLDKFDKSINLLGESVKEWALSHNVGDVGSGEEIAQDILDGEISESSFKSSVVYQEVKRVSEQLMSLKMARDSVLSYIEREMMGFAPNLTKVCGPVIGGRLISLAGGLKKLALMPSGTIQVLGAEKALFRHLKDGSEPPKHGVIFQHELIRNTHWSKRGKLARTLASKIALASRIDYFSGEDKSKTLLEDLEKRKKEVLQ
ncbi:RNA processing factor Prp31 containing Nop domain SIK1 [Methanonatronarchaeum thermophilum]|uniref:RNA processing factor Prp31 containing Nop domain SIK1 n=1 Tax=Methanonatronarchaeum thermophilum TaxID=1927129 RepID=A0A1Y3GJ66_9EURY|nr:hypothetical protein [Methanonatronarchaeum thermophilum]OUJ19485.1 RNA processing factor Prp31 containing Nop domain SIK1 [Methanonatronarchaeum thermophilum]